MQFSKRAVVQRTRIYVRRIWTSECGMYRVSEFKRLSEGTLIYYAERLDVTPTGHCWEAISAHKKREPALAACERDARSTASV